MKAGDAIRAFLGETLVPPRFPIGDVFFTEGVEREIPIELWTRCLDRHMVGDFGDLDPEDVETNERAIHQKRRILSVYKVTEHAVLWIITDHGHERTTLLLPREY